MQELENNCQENQLLHLYIGSTLHVIGMRYSKADKKYYCYDPNEERMVDEDKTLEFEYSSAKDTANFLFKTLLLMMKKLWMKRNLWGFQLTHLA